MCPPAVREAATGIFLWPAWGLYDSIKGDKFKHIEFSHDRVSFESYPILFNFRVSDLPFRPTTLRMAFLRPPFSVQCSVAAAAHLPS
jgi:hypothetical protein